MDTVIKDVFSILSPDLRAIVGAISLACGVFIMIATWLSGKKTGGALVDIGAAPAWSVMGPVHEALQAVHEMNEQSRAQIEIQKTNQAVLRDIDKSMTDLNRGQEYTHRLLEEILRDKEQLRVFRAQQQSARSERRTRQ